MAVPSRPLSLYVATVALFGILGAAWATLGVPRGDLQPLTLLFAVGAAATATATVPLPGTGVRLSADTPFLLALILLGNVGEAVLLSGLDMALATWRAAKGSPKPHAALLNFGAGYLGGVGGVLLHGSAAAVGLPQPVPALAAAAGVFVVNTALVAGAIRIASGRMPGAAWHEGMGVTLLGYLGSGSIAWLLTTVPGSLSPALLAAPLAALIWQAYRSHREKAEEQIARRQDRELVFLPTLEAICSAIEARDPQTFGHNQRVQSLAVDLAGECGVGADELTAVRIGALLHDIGKLAIPDALLHAPRELTAEELMRCRQHAAIGSELVRHVPFPDGVHAIVRHHHERWDGEGYPDRLAGPAIPRLARIVAIIEAYDDMRTSVSHRAAISEEEALGRVTWDAGRAFDPEIAMAFVRMVRRRSGGVPRGSPAEAPEAREAFAAIAASAMEQAKVWGLAFRDEITGLGNARALARDMERQRGRPVGVLVMDLDGFKGINDTFGHAVGDLALRRVGVGLAGLETSERFAYRNGGDEFVVLLPGCPEALLAFHVADVRAALEALVVPVDPGKVVPLRVSIGAALGEPGPALLREADGAMYADKQARRAGRPRGAPPEVRDATPAEVAAWSDDDETVDDASTAETLADRPLPAGREDDGDHAPGDAVPVEWTEAAPAALRPS